MIESDNFFLGQDKNKDSTVLIFRSIQKVILAIFKDYKVNHMLFLQLKIS